MLTDISESVKKILDKKISEEDLNELFIKTDGLKYEIIKDISGTILYQCPILEGLKDIKDKLEFSYLSIEKENTIKNIMIFIYRSLEGMNNEKISKKTREEMINNVKKNNDILNNVVLTLDYITDDLKVEWLANLFLSFLKDELDAIIFLEYTEIIKNAFIEDINFLYSYLKNTNFVKNKIYFLQNDADKGNRQSVYVVGPDPSDYNSFQKFSIKRDKMELIRCYRLSSLGLMREDNELNFTGNNLILQSKDEKTFIISEYAFKLIKTISN